MGTIEKRGRGSWRVGLQVETPAGWQWVRETVHVDPLLSESAQRKLAKKALARLETEVEAGEKGPPGYHYTVRTFSELWLESEVKPNCSPVTYANYKYLIESRIVPLLGDVGLTRLTPVILTQWLAQLRASPRKSTRLPDDRLTHKRPPSRQPRPDLDRPLSVKTLQNYYSCLDTMLDAAVRLNVLKENPMAKVTRPSGRKKRACFLSEERALELLRALADEPNVSYRCALLLALLCGLRLGEVGELKLSDIDFERRTIDISRALKYTPEEGSFVDAPKTDAGMRVISLPEGMMTVLESARAYQEECRQLAPHLWKGEGWLVHGWDGRQLHHDTPSKWFRRFADAHGFEGVTFHHLRHTHASILLANNIDVVAVSSRMGHSDPSVTLRTYAHAIPRRDQDAARTFDRLFSAQLPADPSPSPPADPSLSSPADPSPSSPE